MRLDELLQKNEKWITVLENLQKNPRFKAWFKKSKVMEEGIPKIVYHWGMGDWRLPRAFTHFGTEYAAFQRYDGNPHGKGGSFTIPFILSIQNPLEIPDLNNHTPSDYEDYLIREIPFSTRQSFSSTRSSERFQNIRRIVENNGYDGFDYINKHEHKGSVSYIILRPAQAMPLFKLAKLVL
jgi:hypothetical protein